MSGITDQGFEPKPLEDIKTDLESGFRAVFGAAITIIAQSIFGQIIGIMSDRLADLWQLGLALYNASTREGATGVQLDNIGALTGTARQQATYTKVDCQCAGTNGTVIPSGQVVSVPATAVKFTNDLPGTIGAGPVTITFRALETGPKTAFAGTVTNIETPVAGWSSVTNGLDQSVIGTNVETDAAYRVRQRVELRAQGGSTVASLRAKIQELTGVTGCFVFENTTDLTDGDGLPPHSFECVISGGLDADIAQTICNFKPLGVASFGSTALGATDANGFTVTMHFSRPTVLNAYVVINDTADVAQYPTDGDNDVKNAIAAMNANLGIGVELRSGAIVPRYLPDPEAPTTTGVRGVLDSALPLIGTAPSPGTSAPIVAGNRQQIVLDTSRITVNTTLIAP